MNRTQSSVRRDLVEALAPWAEHWKQQVENAGQSWEDFLCYLEFCYTRRDPPTPDSTTKRGEQVIIWTEGDGSGGIRLVDDLYVELVQVAGVRPEHLPHLVLSGGDAGGEMSRNCLPGTRVLATLRALRPEIFNNEALVTIDAMSKHAGHQGRVLSYLLAALQTKHVGIVAPKNHIPRFLATLGFGCKEFTGIAPTFYPLPHGNWDDRHGSKSPEVPPDQETKLAARGYFPNRGFTQAQLAFDPNMRYRGRSADDPTQHRDDFAELQKLINGWDRRHSYLCHHLNPSEAIDFFGIERF